MRAGSHTLRLLWKQICLTAEEEGKSLKEYLEGIVKDIGKAVQTGMYVTHTSVGGQSAAFTVPGSRDLSQQDLGEAYSFLHDLYNKVMDCTNPPPASDAEACELVLKHLYPVKSMRPDFTLSGWYR